MRNPCSSRLSTGSTFCTKPPKSHSSPERDSDIESTKERIMADFTFKPIQTDVDEDEVEKPFIPLASRVKSRPGSLRHGSFFSLKLFINCKTMQKS